jgi:hypothetical protein
MQTGIQPTTNVNSVNQLIQPENQHIPDQNIMNIADQYNFYNNNIYNNRNGSIFGEPVYSNTNVKSEPNQ